MLVTNSWYWWRDLSPTQLVSNICHHHRCDPFTIFFSKNWQRQICIVVNKITLAYLVGFKILIFIFIILILIFDVYLVFYVSFCFRFNKCPKSFWSFLWITRSIRLSFISNICVSVCSFLSWIYCFILSLNTKISWFKKNGRRKKKLRAKRKIPGSNYRLY